MATDNKYHFDFVLVNQNKVRLTALSVLVLAALYIFTDTWIIPAFLLADFTLRTWNNGKYSVLNSISNIVIDFAGIETIPTNQLPKIFTAGIGVAFAAAILITGAANYTITAKILSGILGLLVFAESVLDFVQAITFIFSTKEYSVRTTAFDRTITTRKFILSRPSKY